MIPPARLVRRRKPRAPELCPRCSGHAVEPGYEARSIYDANVPSCEECGK